MAQDISLPKGWRWVRVADIGKVKGGKRLPAGHTYSDESTNLPYIRVVDFHELTIDSEELKYLKPETQCLIKQYIISKDDVYISIAGSIGKVGVIPEYLDGANLTENAAKITELQAIDNKFLAYVLASPMAQEQISALTISTNQPKLALFRIEKIKIPLAPLAEQHCIVAKIEELFTQLEAGTAALRRIQVGLKRYKASVLKSACEGRLVPQDPSDEPAEELLCRLGNSTLAGEDLPSLPDGWCWAMFKDVMIDGIHNGLYKSAIFTDMNNGTRFLDIKGLYKGFDVDFSNCRRVKLTNNERDKFTLREGDLLINRVSKAPEGVGKSAYVSNLSETTAFESNMMRVRLPDITEAAYINYFLNSDFGRRQVLSRAKTTQQSSVNQGDINCVVIPLPPLAEQHRIIAEVERRLSVVQELEQTVSTSLQRAARLRQAILKQAFEGRLVTLRDDGVSG